MRNNSTLITYIINDFETKENSIILDAETEELLIAMDVEDFAPQQSTIKNILDFARSYDTIKSETAGFIEMNLN
ncbi:MAG: hypothetical protein JXR31_12880 [Prolixibacteraceae bacterium]|nr:hypothetical protein [Prolixibacteraceae bacterium]MBN2775143.1 hypothetical protein [Prolixibacteraceae bacterium]